jgi:hypothetical protein
MAARTYQVSFATQPRSRTRPLLAVVFQIAPGDFLVELSASAVTEVEQHALMAFRQRQRGLRA